MDLREQLQQTLGTAYVLERDGTVLAVVEKVDTKDHAAQLRAVLKGL